MIQPPGEIQPQECQYFVEGKTDFVKRFFCFDRFVSLQLQSFHGHLRPSAGGEYDEIEAAVLEQRNPECAEQPVSEIMLHKQHRPGIATEFTVFQRTKTPVPAEYGNSTVKVQEPLCGECSIGIITG